MREALSAELRNVLLVEDNPGDADLIGELMDSSAGAPRRVHWVTCLNDVETALAADAIDVVLLDLGLPDGSGVDCVSSVRARAAGLPIVVLTGNDDPDLALACISAGAQDYLSKRELNKENLRRAVDYALARGREARERERANALQEHLAAIVDTSRDAIVSSTRDGLISSWNRGAERMFGYAAEEVVGKPFSEYMRAPDRAAAEEQARRLAAARAGQASTHADEVIRLHKDGTPIVLSVVTSILRDGAGEVIGAAAIARDITDAKRRSEELANHHAALVRRDQQMRALARRLNAIREEERTRLSREVHDELGQLLTGLKMDLRWIGRRLTSDEPPDGGLIGARLAEAEALVDSTVAAVQRIALELRPSALDALGLPAAIRDEARRFEARSGVIVDAHVQPGLSPPSQISTELFRILQELLTNVLRHARASAVRIELNEAERDWVLCVADDGVGLGASGQRPSSLGLLGMKERAESLGGSISLESKPEQGTIATVRVPRELDRDDA